MNDSLINQEVNISNYMDYAQNLSYAGSGLQSSIGLTPLVVNGQVVQTYDTQNGVQAEAFITTGSGPQRIVVGYAGTGVDFSGSGTSSLYSSPSSSTGQPGDAFTGAQFYDDVGIFAGQTPTGAAASATAFANEVTSDAAQLGLGKSDVYLTGHDLGGTLAEYAASKTDLAGTTFGAAGISIKGSGKASNFKNIVLDGDPIGNYAADGQDPLGPLVLSPNIKHYGTVQLIGSASDQDTLRAGATQAYAEASDPGQADDLGSVLGLLLQAPYNSLSEAYAPALGSKVTLTDFGSYASPTVPSSSGASAPTATPAETAVQAPVVHATTPTAAPPSTQVIEQDINICNYLYHEKGETFDASNLQQLGLQPLIQNGRTVQIYSQKAGVFGEAFETTTNGSPSQIIIAYEGTETYGEGNTNKFTGGQLLDDAALFAGKQAAGATPAGNFADRVLGIASKMGIAASQVSVTGHSLGAAEAEYAAEKTGLGGVTFGTPGIVVDSNEPSQLTNFVDDGDPVGNYATDGNDPMGDFVTASNITHYGGPTYLATTPKSSPSGTVPSNAPQTSLATTTQQFFTPGTSDYKNILTAGGDIVSDGYYHHLTTYATSLKNDDYGDIYLVCYCSGTAIRTAYGDRAVETLQAGDLVVTASGETRPIKWIGHRSIDCRKAQRPPELWPVRIAAHALGENRPARDLLVSPGHSICLDIAGEFLVPAGALVNGTTIIRQPVEQVTYWHVELDSHDLLLAENQPAESYLEMGNRTFFVESGAVTLHARPDASIATHADFCRPFVDNGPRLELARARLAVIAEALAARDGRRSRVSARRDRREARRATIAWRCGNRPGGPLVAAEQDFGLERDQASVARVSMNNVDRPL